MRLRSALAFSLAAALALLPALAGAEDAPKAKLGPEATPIFAAPEYFRSAPAADYWTLASFYVPQTTTSDCSAAAIVMLINALRGLPARADEQVLSEHGLLTGVGDDVWMGKITEDGSGVTFAETGTYLRKSLDAFGLTGATIAAVQPKPADPGALEALRAALAANEASGDDVMLIYFNQGVLTGDWDGPHISPIGAYDAARDRVLIMDVDRDWYVPYWTPTTSLLAALQKPAPAEQGPLAGETGGWLVATKPKP